MQDSPRSDIGELIAAIENGRAERLPSAMTARCWPVGSADRSDRVALDWVRRMTPRPGAAADIDVSHN